MDPRALIRTFIEDNFVLHGSTTPLEDDTSLLDTGRVDSTGVLTLVAYIEDTFGIAVNDEDLIPDNFDSIDRIIGYIDRTALLAREAS